LRAFHSACIEDFANGSGCQVQESSFILFVIATMSLMHVLPPKAIKDAERVGFLSNVFSVGDCQPNSLEFALADPQGVQFDEKTAQRFLLSKGDMFQIPPFNSYRIENHSKTEDAKLFYTLIKSTSRAEQECSESDGEN
jgi:hypothetical protein